MINFANKLPDDEANRWRFLLDEFVEENQQELAALAWGLLQEWEDSNDTLGIDLIPKPHFIRCSRDAIERLNRKVNRKIQEILGVLDGYNRETEVVAIAIGDGQVKLIYFQPDPSPLECFEEMGEDLNALIEQLETRLQEKLK